MCILHMEKEKIERLVYWVFLKNADKMSKCALLIIICD